MELEIAENEGHHPDIFGWGYAIINFNACYSRFTENDFILAKIDQKLMFEMSSFEKTKIVSVSFANFIISLSLIEPEG